MVCPMLLGSCVVHGGWFVHQQTAGSDGREEKGDELAAAVCTPLTTTSLHQLLHRHLSTVRSAAPPPTPLYCPLSETPLVHSWTTASNLSTACHYEVQHGRRFVTANLGSLTPLDPDR